MSNDEAFISKFRPRNPNQLIGDSQKEVIRTLLGYVKKGKPLKRVMFIGDSGVGKTTLSEIYIRAILNLDETTDILKYIQHMNCSSETGIDYTRYLVNHLSLGSIMAEYKIILMDEIHGLSTHAQNAWLTPLESLPPHVIVIACTTEERKIIKTFKRRFTIYRLQKPSREELQKKCLWYCKKFEIVPKGSIINEIVDRSEGNVGILDDLMQQFVDGSYSSFDDMTKDEKFFGRRLLFENWSLQQTFNEADRIEDYPGITVGMCRYAIGVLKKSNNSNCRKLLEIFGDGLSPNVDSKTNFYKKLMEYKS